MNPELLTLQNAIRACTISGVPYLSAELLEVPVPTIGVQYRMRWVRDVRRLQMIHIEYRGPPIGRIGIYRRDHTGAPQGLITYFNLPGDLDAAVAHVENVMSKAMPVLHRCLSLMGYDVGEIWNDHDVARVNMYYSRALPSPVSGGPGGDRRTECVITSRPPNLYHLEFFGRDHSILIRRYDIPAPTTVQGGVVQVTPIVKEVLGLIAHMMPVCDETDEEHPMPRTLPPYMFPWTNLPYT